MEPITIGELKRKIENLPDDTVIKITIRVDEYIQDTGLFVEGHLTKTATWAMNKNNKLEILG